MKLWNFLNGKKTAIGTLVLIASGVISEVVVGIWKVDGGWVEPTIKTLEWIGMAFGGVGLIHKQIKKTP